MGFLQNRFDYREEKKLDGARSEEYGCVPKLQCFFLRETDKYPGLYEQEGYREGASMRELPECSASSHALIVRGAKKSLYRPFGSLLCLGVGIRNKRCLKY